MTTHRGWFDKNVHPEAARLLDRMYEPEDRNANLRWLERQQRRRPMIERDRLTRSGIKSDPGGFETTTRGWRPDMMKVVVVALVFAITAAILAIGFLGRH